MRRFAISDIHGCAKTFKALLQRIAFSKEDILFLLGDYIDRGPDSRGVIDHIWELQEDGFTVHCLRGNHEQMLLDELKAQEYYYNGEKATLHSFQVKANQDIPKPYIEWMEELPYFFALDDYILVHAGLNFNSKFPLQDETEMIWIRHWYDNIDRQWLGDRIIVHGHTPTRQLEIKRSVKELDEIPALDIDAGCVFESFGFGHLCALNLDTKEFIFQANVDTVYNWKGKEIITLIGEQIPLPSPKNKLRTTKVLYFDIDGTLLDYDDVPKTALVNGSLETVLKEEQFDFIACVSGWVDIFAEEVMGLHSLEKRKAVMYQKLELLFPDKAWFMEKIILVTDSDNRCKYIDLKVDWFYMDDWADKFFVEAHDEIFYQKEKGNRILLCDHRGDGNDILDWLSRKEIKR